MIFGCGDPVVDKLVLYECENPQFLQNNVCRQVPIFYMPNTAHLSEQIC